MPITLWVISYGFSQSSSGVLEVENDETGVHGDVKTFLGKLQSISRPYFHILINTCKLVEKHTHPHTHTDTHML